MASSAAPRTYRHLAHRAPLPIVEYSLEEARRSFDDHIQSGAPCVVRGAIADWPACERWLSLQYWTSVASDKTVEYHDTPGPKDQVGRQIPARDAVTTLFSAADQYSMVYFELGPAAQFAVDGDVRPFSFGPSWMSSTGTDYKRGVCYPPLRAFMHRHSYTKWHDHPTDDTLTIQIGGTKRFSMVPSTPENTRVVSSGEDPEGAGVRPFVADVGHGDAIFIPPKWQHAVEAAGELGVTLACTFRTPKHRR